MAAVCHHTNIVLRDAEVSFDAISTLIERPFKREHRVVRRVEVPIAAVADYEAAVAGGVGPACTWERGLGFKVAGLGVGDESACHGLLPRVHSPSKSIGEKEEEEEEGRWECHSGTKRSQAARSTVTAACRVCSRQKRDPAARVAHNVRNQSRQRRGRKHHVGSKFMLLSITSSAHAVVASGGRSLLEEEDLLWALLTRSLKNERQNQYENV